MNYNRIVMVFLCVVFIYSTYKIVFYFLEKDENKRTYSVSRELYYGDSQVELEQATDLQPTMITMDSYESEESEPQPIVQVKFKALLEKNQDVVGWLKIDGTTIDYPVVQAEDNDYYLTRDVNKKKNAAGSIFMDFRSDIESILPYTNTIVYGHRMKDGSMFGELKKYESRWQFDNYRSIELDTLYESYEWEIFSVYITDTSLDYIQTEFSTTEDYLEFLQLLQEKSMHESDIELSEDDILLTLSTCSYAFDDARLAVHARLVRN